MYIYTYVIGIYRNILCLYKHKKVTSDKSDPFFCFFRTIRFSKVWLRGVKQVWSSFLPIAPGSEGSKFRSETLRK